MFCSSMTTLIFNWNKLNFLKGENTLSLDVCGRDINRVLRVANRTHFKWTLKEIKEENTILLGNQQQKTPDKLSM